MSVLMKLKLIFLSLILGSQRFCKCKECKGSWISKRAFYDHQIKLTNSFKCACIPKFDWNTEICEDEKYIQPLFQGSDTSVLEAITRHITYSL